MRLYFRAFPGYFTLACDIPDVSELDHPDATYAEIMEWISEHYNGMRVTKTCIANAKRRAGIGVEDHGSYPVHQPNKKTIQKENAVLAAFEHFGMMPA